MTVTFPDDRLAEHPAVGEWLAMSGRALPALETWRSAEPDSPVARMLWVLSRHHHLSDGVLRAELVRAHADAKAAGAVREQSLVHAAWLFTHQAHRRTAEHLVAHFAQYPADVLAATMLGAFDQCGSVDHRKRGEQLIEEQYRLAGPESWAWASCAAAARVEQGRIEDAWYLAEHALRVNPRSGPAAHARAHAEHHQGTGPGCTRFIDTWLDGDPQAIQRPHLQWHAALQDLASGDVEGARRRADAELREGDVGMRAAANWRLLLAGHTPARTTDTADLHRLMAEPGGWAEVFHTFQLALALAVAADTDALTTLARRAGADERSDYRDVLAPVAHALAHLSAGRPGPAVDLLSGLDHQIERIGGVRVEREIIQDTLARALIDAGDPDRAAALLHHRRTTRHHHTYEDQLLTQHPTTGTRAQRPLSRPHLARGERSPEGLADHGKSVSGVRAR
ncbi:hypothetical protein [Streptomyces iconiensis]|uniref:Tetratricopeptide repeat-containing protein n=1 Tax=Streptomyces iconiensis TaxID=1384038 RepID=A0ABT7A0N7_9ACTN|nr:hypothetical protein [Streptomyces iconiensis]MDJ1134188.1 hypothetical protein [Streptomyces iconiensis]